MIMDSSVPMSSNASGVLRSSNKVSTSQSFDPREIHLVVNLPEDAKMFVNGNATTSTGTSRHFVSRNLNEGESYRFELKAVLADANGNEVRWSGITSTGEFVALIQYYTQLTLNLYNSSGTLITRRTIPKSSASSLSAILILKINNAGTDIQYIRSTGIYQFSCNNGLSIDSNNNVYATINDPTVLFGTNVNFGNESSTTIASVSRINSSGTLNELATIKIPASFTPY